MRIASRKFLFGGLVLTMVTAPAMGCHGDTAQGGAPDRGRSGSSAPVQPRPEGQVSVPTPPSADQLDPNSPQAVINGTSTTRPGVTNRPAPPPPPRSAPQ